MAVARKLVEAPAFRDPTRYLYRSGAAAAVAMVALVVISAPLLILYPYPTTVLGHLTQIHDNKLIGLVNADLLMLVSELLGVVVFVALFVALRRASRALMTAALGLSLSGIVLYVAVNPTFSLLYASDQYSAATTDAQRAAWLAAAQALWANYMGTAFAVAYIAGGIATLIIASVMLRSRIFNRWTAYVGFVVGAFMLVPPAPSFGTVGLVIAFLSLIPLAAWDLLVAWRLFRLGST